MKENNYVIITCVRNEDEVIAETIQSVLNQSILPKEWLIVDDDSTDRTFEIIKSYSDEYSWIRCKRNTEVTLNEKGARIASMINHYSSQIEYKDYNYISKLDGDLKLPRDFYEKIIEEFKLDSKLGIASGALIYKGKKEKNIYDDLTRGATKFYRRDCFVDIGGLSLTTGWDTLDNIMAQSKGWKTRVLEVWFEHLEEEGASQGFVKKYYHAGKYYGKIPYHSWYFLLKLMYRIFDKPYFISGIILTYGYLKTRVIKRERPFPKEVTSYFRNKQKELVINGIKSYLK